MDAMRIEPKAAIKLFAWLALAGLGVVSAGCGANAGATPAVQGGQQTSRLPSGGQSLPPLIQPPVNLPRLPVAGTTEPGLNLATGDLGNPSGPAAPVTSATVPTGSRSDFENQVDAYMLVLINEERAKVGAQPLRIDPRLHEAALAHALDMFGRGYIDHQNASGEWGHDRAARAGFPVTGGMESVNENVADVFTRMDPAEMARTCMWEYKQSDGHWKNILDPKWNVCGLATIHRPDQAKTDAYGEKMNPNCQLFGKL